MRSMRTTLVFAAIAFMGFLRLPALAEDQPKSASEQKKFNLNATVTAKPQLSRAEIDPSAIGAGGFSSPPMSLPPGPSQSQNDAARLAMLAQQARLAALQAKQAQTPLQGRADDDAPGAFMREYNVDWSRWVSVVADRWFYVLRNAEYLLGIQFQTERPALIQFTCYADGTIGNVILKQSSGVPAYDRLQIASLLQAVPTPPFPAGTHRKSITLVQGWESHPKRPGEEDFQPGTFGRDFPLERVRKWCAGLQ